MNLRPHHILCIQKFTGHGYDETFTEHMKSTVSMLRSNGDAKIAIIRGCDELCLMCPNRKGNVCTSLEKVEGMDENVLQVCGLSYGDRIAWKELAGTAQKLIFETEECHRTCSCCQWYELCKRTEVYHEQS